MKTKCFLVFVTFLNFGAKILQAEPRTQFNSITCDAVDKNFVEFEKCHIKVISRNRRAGIVAAKIKSNTTECMIHAKVMQQLNGWHPFLYEIKIDACDFFRNPKKYPVFNAAYQLGKHTTNAQHKCPYVENEYIRVFMPEMDQVRIRDYLQLFPIDVGRYGVFIKFFTKGKLRATVNTTTTYTDYEKRQ